MNVKLSTALVNEGKYATVSPEMLEMMGKQAANEFVEKGISLNESISKLAAAHEDINQEQIKRVCEFANTAVYLAKHDMAKTSGAKESYPEFDLADPNRVIQDLSDGTKSTITTKVDADYSRLPLEKTSSVNHSAEKALEELFNPKSEETPEFSKESAVSEVLVAKNNLKDLRDNLRSSGEQFDLLHKEASAEFYELSKRHILDGGSFADIVKAASSVGASDYELNSVLTPVVKRLITEKVAASSQVLVSQMKDLEKLAHRTANQEHPMVKAAGAIISSNREIEKVAYGLREVESCLDQVNLFIKEKFSAGMAR